MIKSRLIKLERIIEPLKPQKPRRTWIVAGKDPERRIKRIRNGAEKHPINGGPFKESDEFMKIQIVNVRPEKSTAGRQLEAALYAMAKGERPPAEDELKRLKARKAEIEKALNE